MSEVRIVRTNISRHGTVDYSTPGGKPTTTVLSTPVPLRHRRPPEATPMP
ncbi:MAG TPA: hypothetical protein VG122_01445 [Gemmata sp.]|nr:hypothetical protein [Gemmata sp.]